MAVAECRPSLCLHAGAVAWPLPLSTGEAAASRTASWGREGRPQRRDGEWLQSLRCCSPAKLPTLGRTELEELAELPWMDPVHRGSGGGDDPRAAAAISHNQYCSVAFPLPAETERTAEEAQKGGRGLPPCRPPSPHSSPAAGERPLGAVARAEGERERRLHATLANTGGREGAQPLHPVPAAHLQDAVPDQQEGA